MKNSCRNILGLFVALAAALPFFSIRAETTLEESINRVDFKESRVRTGEDSRAELSNEGGTIRVGANSEVGIRSGEKTFDLEKGVMMVNTTRKGLKRQSVTVETDQVRATTNATMIISYQPGRYIKVACTGGSVTVTLKSLSKESVTIRKGQMLVINCLENVLPGAVSVDMNQLMATSPLFAPNLRLPPRGAGAPGRGGAAPRNGPQGPPPPNLAAGPRGQGPRPLNAPTRRMDERQSQAQQQPQQPKPQQQPTPPPPPP